MNGKISEKNVINCIFAVTLLFYTSTFINKIAIVSFSIKPHRFKWHILQPFKENTDHKM